MLVFNQLNVFTHNFSILAYKMSEKTISSLYSFKYVARRYEFRIENFEPTNHYGRRRSSAAMNYIDHRYRGIYLTIIPILRQLNPYIFCRSSLVCVLHIIVPVNIYIYIYMDEDGV